METRILPTDPPELLHGVISEAVRLLAAGEVVALPTETVYGLAADALNATAVARIFEAKERPSFDPLIVHLPHKSALDTVADIPEDIAPAVKRLAERFWPGPLTLILPKKSVVPDIVTAGLPTVAVRASSNLIFNRVARTLGRPLAAPSANRFGSISPTSAGAVKAELEGRIPLIVDGGASLHGLESTIVKVENVGESKPRFVILRPGPITPDDLKPFGRPFFPGKTRDHTRPSHASQGHAAPLEAPGQTQFHYAPRTPLRLLESPREFVPDPSKTYALLSFRGEASDGYLPLAPWKQTFVLSPGSGKMSEAAVRFFYALRQLDQSGVDEIIAEPIAERGLGLAMMDRLRRAAAKTSAA
jgi:L-threonylcarbamoyladenylate synthase